MNILKPITIIAATLFITVNANAVTTTAKNVAVTKEMKNLAPKGHDVTLAYNMGDLNKDLKDDYALVIVSKDKKDNEGSGLMMMMSDKDAKYSTPLVKTKFIDSHLKDSTSLFSFETHNNKFQILFEDQKGDYRFLFKYIAKNGGWFKLIASEHKYMEGEKTTRKANINYLTEKMTIEENNKTVTYRIKVDEELNFKKIEALDFNADRKHQESGTQE